uniref:Uncharacterized protein n=1 Tax=Myoviridae sp. ctGBP5 TaxID=2825071 RepID=A0A8S5PCZ2_9CAUD|nr:MAG TPA: hypothetical protein [Myoviridae sp. ctGBP5]
MGICNPAGGRWVNICRSSWSRQGKPGRSANWCRAERSAHWINSRLLKRVFLPLIRT